MLASELFAVSKSMLTIVMGSGELGWGLYAFPSIRWRMRFPRKWIEGIECPQCLSASRFGSRRPEGLPQKGAEDAKIDQGGRGVSPLSRSEGPPSERTCLRSSSFGGTDARRERRARGSKSFQDKFFTKLELRNECVLGARGAARGEARASKTTALRSWARPFSCRRFSPGSSVHLSRAPPPRFRTPPPRSFVTRPFYSGPWPSYANGIAPNSPRLPSAATLGLVHRCISREARCGSTAGALNDASRIGSCLSAGRPRRNRLRG